jgi:hypothetical protein
LREGVASRERWAHAAFRDRHAGKRPDFQDKQLPRALDRQALGRDLTTDAIVDGLDRRGSIDGGRRRGRSCRRVRRKRSRQVEPGHNAYEDGGDEGETNPDTWAARD